MGVRPLKFLETSTPEWDRRAAPRLHRMIGVIIFALSFFLSVGAAELRYLSYHWNFRGCNAPQRA
jgi:hypothetical protein